MKLPRGLPGHAERGAPGIFSDLRTAASRTREPVPLRAREDSNVDDARSLDRLVSELNSSANQQIGRTTPLADWLERLRAEAGSDLYLVAGLPPAIRVDG